MPRTSRKAYERPSALEWRSCGDLATRRGWGRRERFRGGGRLCDHLTTHIWCPRRERRGGAIIPRQHVLFACNACDSRSQFLRRQPRNPLPRYLRTTGATVCLLIFFVLQYEESNQSASHFSPLLALQLPQHRVMFHTFGCLTERPSMCSQLARLLRLRAPILNFRLQYTQDLSLRATCRTIRGGMRYFFAFLKTRDEIPHLFVISSSPRFGLRLTEFSSWRLLLRCVVEPPKRLTD
jgi:hypothetical protein